MSSVQLFISVSQNVELKVLQCMAGKFSLEMLLFKGTMLGKHKI